MKITIREKDGVIILDIEEEIKRSEKKNLTLHRVVKNQLANGKIKILLNLEKVKFIDSNGVGEVLSCYISTHRSGGKLKLAKLSNKTYLIFQITMLTNVLEIFDDEEKAIKSFFENSK